MEAGRTLFNALSIQLSAKVDLLERHRNRGLATRFAELCECKSAYHSTCSTSLRLHSLRSFLPTSQQPKQETKLHRHEVVETLCPSFLSPRKHVLPGESFYSKQPIASCARGSRPTRPAAASVEVVANSDYKTPNLLICPTHAISPMSGACSERAHLSHTHMLNTTPTVHAPCQLFDDTNQDPQLSYSNAKEYDSKREHSAFEEEEEEEEIADSEWNGRFIKESKCEEAVGHAEQQCTKQQCTNTTMQGSAESLENDSCIGEGGGCIRSNGAQNSSGDHVPDHCPQASTSCENTLNMHVPSEVSGSGVDDLRAMGEGKLGGWVGMGVVASASVCSR